MDVITPIDIEDALHDDLDGLGGVRVYAPPLPDDFDEHLPAALVMNAGGGRHDMVVDEHDVIVSVYGATWAKATDAARKLAAYAAALPYDDTTSIRYQDVELNAGVTDDPDPAHPSIPRVRFTITVTTRATVSHE